LGKLCGRCILTGRQRSTHPAAGSAVFLIFDRPPRRLQQMAGRSGWRWRLIDVSAHRFVWRIHAEFSTGTAQVGVISVIR
jgi:hypothetical protein